MGTQAEMQEGQLPTSAASPAERALTLPVPGPCARLPSSGSQLLTALTTGSYSTDSESHESELVALFSK